MHFGESVDTTGATDEDLAVIFGVEIDEPLMLQHTVLQFHSTGKPCLFIDGKETFYRRMLKLRIGDGSECHRDTYTIVGSKRSTFRFKPFAINIGFNRVSHEIMDHITVFFAYHVHVGLQDNTFMILIAGRSGYTHDHIHRFVGDALNTMRSSERLEPLTDFLLMFGRTGNFADLCKNLKYFVFHISFVLIVC